MKIITSLVIASFFLTNLFQAFAYKIEVEISGLENEFLYLGMHYGPDFKVIDTTKTNNKGYAVFQSKNVLPVGVYFIVIPPKTHFDFIINEDQEFKISSTLDDLLGNLKMTGIDKPDLFFDMQRDVAMINLASSQLEIKKQYYRSSQQSLPSEIIREEDSLKNRRKIVYEYYKSLSDKNSYLYKIITLMLPLELPSYIQRWQTEDPKRYYYYYKDHYFDAVDFSDQSLLRTPDFVFHRMLQEYNKFFISSRADSIEAVFNDLDALIAKTSVNIEFEKYILTFFIDYYENPTVVGLDTIFIFLANKYFLSDKLSWVDKTAKQLIKERCKELSYDALGKKANNLTLKKLDGELISLSDFNSKYIILWFWEPDCELCNELTTNLNLKYEDLKKLDTEVIAVNIGKDKKEWENYIIDKKLYFINAWDPDGKNDLVKYYGTYRTPRLFILDTNKIIVGKDVKPNDLINYIKYLDNKKK